MHLKYVIYPGKGEFGDWNKKVIEIAKARF